MREKFIAILKDHGIYGEDIEEILCAVSDMLTFAAKENESYATDSIDCLETAAYAVWNLITDL